MIAVAFLKSLVKKAGLNPEDDKYKDFFSNAELGKIDVPDELATATDNSLISLTTAKDNFGPLKNHYTALALNGIDTNMEQMLDELGLGDDDKTELKLEKNTGKRIQALVKKVQTAEAKKANADKPDKVAIQKTIDDLNRQVLAERQKAVDAEAGFKQKEKQLRLDYTLTNLFGNQKTVFDKLSPDIRNATLRTAISQELQRKQAKIDFDDSGNVVILRQDGTNYFGDNNQPVTPVQFIEQTFAKENLLEKANSSHSNSGQSNSGNSGSNQQINGNTEKVDSKGKQVVGQNSIFKELMENSQKDFKNVNGVPTT